MGNENSVFAAVCTFWVPDFEVDWDNGLEEYLRDIEMGTGREED